MTELLFFLWIVLFLCFVELSERRKEYERNIAEWKYLMHGCGDIWAYFIIKRQIEKEAEYFSRIYSPFGYSEGVTAKDIDPPAKGASER